MDEKRKGEIAFELWIHWIVKEGIPGQTVNGVRRNLGNVSKATGIPLNELAEFLGEILNEIAKRIRNPASKINEPA